MTRKKLKLAYITDNYVRKATFKKRKNGLMKKVSELSTLCGVDACAIVYSPYNLQPEVWPSDIGVRRVVSQFKQKSEMDQNKKMLDQESFLRERIMKATEKLNKQARSNRENEMLGIMFQSLVGSIPPLNLLDLNDLGWVIDQYLKNIYNRCASFSYMAVGESSSAAGGAAEAEAEAAAVVAPLPPPPVEAPPPPPPPGHGGMQNIAGTSQTAAAAGGGGDEMNKDSVENQQWILELLNTPDQQQFGFGGEDMILPFGDTNPNPHWSHDFFP